MRLKSRGSRLGRRQTEPEKGHTVENQMLVKNPFLRQRPHTDSETLSISMEIPKEPTLKEKEKIIIPWEEERDKHDAWAINQFAHRESFLTIHRHADPLKQDYATWPLSQKNNQTLKPEMIILLRDEQEEWRETHSNAAKERNRMGEQGEPLQTYRLQISGSEGEVQWDTND